MKYTTEIKYDEWKDGDIICFPVNSYKGKPSWDLVCEVKDGKIIELPGGEEIVPDKNWKCIRIDYKFISDGTWYIEGTEVYPTHEVSSEKNDWGAVFKGWTNETFKGYEGELPRWDGEGCGLDEFEITKRIVL